MRNFTTYPEMPDPQALITYAARPKRWGSIGLGLGPHISRGRSALSRCSNSLTLLTAVAARTTRIKLGTGVLVLPLRNPVVLAKELASLDLIAGGDCCSDGVGVVRREFDAVGVPFEQRGRIMDRNLEIFRRLWTEEQVDGEYPPHRLRGCQLVSQARRLPT